MPIEWHRKWGLIAHFGVSPIEWAEKWTLRDLMEAMTAKALMDDAEVLQANARLARMKSKAPR